MAAGNEPAEAAVRVNTLKAERLELPPCPRAPADRLPEGLVLDAPFDAFSLAAVGAGPVHAAVARRDGGRARRSTRSPASACWTCAPPPAARRPTWRP